jgi:GAF domain-containing protein
MKVHPVVGAEILERARFPFPVAPIVRCHHEKWDGSGYPAGIEGEAIPIGARILAAVDCFDALASDRQYRRALPLHEAMAVVEREAGKSFDPQVVAILQRRYIELEHLARNSRPDPWRLSTDIQIEKGEAPAAGFASSGESDADPASRIARESRNGVDHKRLETLLTSADSIEGVLTMDETLALFAARLAKTVRFNSLALFVPQSDVLRPAFVTGQHGLAIESLRIPFGQGLTGWVARANRSILNGNPAVEPGWAEPSGLRSAMAVPLETSSGLVGVLTMYSGAENGFSSEDLAFLCRVGPALSRYIERNAKAAVAALSSLSAFSTETAPVADRALQHVT